MKNRFKFFNRIEPSKTIPGRNDYWTSDGFYVEAVPPTSGSHWVIISEGRTYDSAPSNIWVRSLEQAMSVIQAERKRFWELQEELRHL